MSSTGSVRAVLFDADGVIQRSGAFPAHVQSELGWSEEDFHGFLSDLFSHPLYEGCLEGRASFLPLLGALLEPRTCSMTPAQFMADWHRVGIETVPGAFELVEQLRAAGVICCLATNQDPERAVFMDEQLGYAGRFDHSFYSCRMGVRKPAPEYFRHALAVLELAPEQVLFLDDHPANVDAAMQVGLRAEVITATSDLTGVVRGHRLLEPDPTAQ
ncbi:MAG: HAD family hydrolase [Acidimicrobiales bacterium]